MHCRSATRTSYFWSWDVPNMLPNMFNLSALGQVTTMLLLWFSVASIQIMDSPFCHHNATRFTLICSLFGDGRMNPPVIYHASLLFNVLLLLSNSFFSFHRSTRYAATAMTQQVCLIFFFVIEIFLVLWCIYLTTLFLGYSACSACLRQWTSSNR